MKELRNQIGVMFETGDQLDLNGVVNGIYAIEEPTGVCSDYPDGYRRYVMVSAGSLQPNSRFVFMGDFPEFPERQPDVKCGQGGIADQRRRLKQPTP